MSNIILKIDYLYGGDCLDLLSENRKSFRYDVFDYDPFLEIEFTPTFEIDVNEDKEMVGLIIEAGMEDIDKALEKGLDHKLTGLYDLPEWGIKDYTAGELLLEVQHKLYGGYSKKTGSYKRKWTKHLQSVKYLKRGNLKFPEVSLKK